MKRLILTLAISLTLSAQCFGQALEFGALGGAYIGPMLAQVSNVTGNAPTTLTFTGADTGWCARVMATNTKDFKSVAVNFSAATTPGTATIRIETVDANGKPSGTLYDAAATKSFTPAAGWNVITFDSLPTTGTTAGTMYAVVMLKDDAGTTCTLRSSTNGNTYGNWPTAVLTASSGQGGTRSNFAEVVNVTPIGYFVMDDDTLTSMGCAPVGGAGTVFALQSANHAVAQKIVLEKEIVIRGVRFASNTGFSRYGTPTVDIRMRILDSSNVAVSGTTVTIDKDTLTQTNGRGLTIPLPPTTLAAGTYRVCFDSAGDGSHGFGVSYVTIADAALQSAGFCYSQSTDMGTTFTWTDTPTRVLPFGLELDSIPADAGGGGGDAVDQISIVPFYGSDIAEDSGDYPFEFNVYQNGVPFALSSGAVQASLDGGADAATGLTLSTIATGRYKVVIDSDSSAFDGGGNLNLTLSAGTVDSVDVTNAKVGEVSIGRNAVAPTNFESLSVDGSGAVIIQDGTGAGQIATTSGAIDTVTTVTQLTAATTEPTSVPSATAGFIDKVNWLFLIARNKKNVTDAIIQYFADDGSTVVGEKDLSDNGTTYTETEAAAP